VSYERRNQYRNLRLRQTRRDAWNHVRVKGEEDHGDFDDFGREGYAASYHYTNKKRRGVF